MQRFGLTLLVLWGVLSLVFLVLHLTPGDPVEVMLGEFAQTSDRAALRRQLNLDLPLWQQYGLYVKQLLSGDLGMSLHQKKPVAELIIQQFPFTASLAISSMIFALLMALPLGVIAAYYQDSWVDRATLGVAIIGVSVPNFVMGPLLILVFSFWLQWVPLESDAEWVNLILPTVALGTALMGILARMIRSSLLQVWHEPYLLAARARGESAWLVLFKHALPNALLPVVTVMGLQLGTLLGGAVITEVVFSRPGLGSTLISAIENRDYPVVQGCILVVTLAYVMVNLCTDWLYGRLDPRVRVSG